eukprot:GHVU01089186.1.p2 GENE.GHVU01089186.1~~GHVU01089186.1.p2  ORF type:complete len:145 (+),score=25.49 GHVU01089186.1:193-627(+)
MMQVTRSCRPVYISDTVRHVYAVGGWRSFFNGNGTNCVKVAPEVAIRLFAYDFFKRQIIRHRRRTTTAVSPSSAATPPAAAAAAPTAAIRPPPPPPHPPHPGPPGSTADVCRLGAADERRCNDEQVRTYVGGSTASSGGGRVGG